MTCFLIVIFFIQLIFVVSILKKIEIEQMKSASILKILEQKLFLIHKVQQKSFIKLELSDFLKNKMTQVSVILNEKLFEFNYQLFEEINIKKSK